MTNGTDWPEDVLVEYLAQNMADWPEELSVAFWEAVGARDYKTCLLATMSLLEAHAQHLES